MIALGSLEKPGNISAISSAWPCRRGPLGNYMTKCSSCTLIGSTEVRSGVQCSPQRLQSDTCQDSVSRRAPESANGTIWSGIGRVEELNAKEPSLNLSRSEERRTQDV